MAKADGDLQRGLERGKESSHICTKSPKGENDQEVEPKGKSNLYDATQFLGTRNEKCNGFCASIRELSTLRYLFYDFPNQDACHLVRMLRARTSR